MEFARVSFWVGRKFGRVVWEGVVRLANGEWRSRGEIGSGVKVLYFGSDAFYDCTRTFPITFSSAFPRPVGYPARPLEKVMSTENYTLHEI